MNATDELALKLPAPEVSESEVEELLKVLDDAEGWLTAKEIASRLGMRECEASWRLVRKIASAAAPRVVSFPGSPGYKLWQLCEIGEINHCIEAFQSQARDMNKRAVLYLQAYHRRFRGAPPGSVADSACQMQDPEKNAATNWLLP